MKAHCIHAYIIFMYSIVEGVKEKEREATHRCDKPVNGNDI